MLRVKRILLPTDQSPSAEAAYTYAVAIANRFGAQLHVIHVVSSHAERNRERGSLLPVEWNDVVEQLRLPAPQQDVPRPIEVCTLAATPAEGIVTYAIENEIDLIVMGTRGKSAFRTPLSGGAAHFVVRNAPCPVLAVRERLPARGINRVMVPVDFSDASQEAALSAMELAKLLGAKLDVLHVPPPGSHPSAFSVSSSPHPAPGMATEWIEKIEAFISQSGGPEVSFAPHIRVGPVAPTIINFALERRADLIVMGSHGRSGIQRKLMGCIAEAVVRRSPCAALVTKQAGSPLSPSVEHQAEERRLLPRFRTGKGTPVRVPRA